MVCVSLASETLPRVTLPGGESASMMRARLARDLEAWKVDGTRHMVGRAEIRLQSSDAHGTAAASSDEAYARRLV